MYKVSVVDMIWIVAGGYEPYIGCSRYGLWAGIMQFLLEREDLLQGISVNVARRTNLFIFVVNHKTFS